MACILLDTTKGAEFVPSSAVILPSLFHINSQLLSPSCRDIIFGNWPPGGLPRELLSCGTLLCLHHQ